jgi:hypothetical protein
MGVWLRSPAIMKLFSFRPYIYIRSENTRAIPKSTSDWLIKKYKKEKKTLLYGTVTYITAFLLRIVVIHI